MEQNQVVRDVEETGIPAAKDGLILLTVAELAAPGEKREFFKTPISTAKGTGGFSSGTITPGSISFALLRMADRGTIVELKRSQDLLVGRIADYCWPVEIAMA